MGKKENRIGRDREGLWDNEGMGKRQCGAQCGEMGNREEETGNPAGRETGKQETGRDTGDRESKRHRETRGEGGEDYVITRELAGGNIT